MKNVITPLYKSTETKKEILVLYDAKLNELNIDYKSIALETQFGQTNVIVTGSPSKAPLVLVHGSNGCAPIALDVYPSLAKHYQVFAVDVIAQPNKSSETRPSMKDASYGIWMNEVISALELSDVTLVGFSLGGFIIWKTLAYDESSIKEAFLIAPVGIVNGNPLKAMRKMFFPMKRFMRTQNAKDLDSVIDTLFSERDDFAPEFLAKVIPNFDLDFTPIPSITEKEARRISTPLTMIAAEHDVLGPGKKLLQRSKNIFPSLKQAILLENSKHVQSLKDNKRVEDLIIEGAIA